MPRDQSPIRPAADGTVDPLVRGNASGRATRETLIRTAERLFAERGLEAVSLREIRLACGQRNNYVTQYHFGDRDGLVMAIYEFRGRELNDERLRAVAQLEADGLVGDPVALLRALLEPHAAHIGDPDWNFLGFLAQVQAGRGQLGYFEAARPEYMRGFDLIREHLWACFPALTAETFARRFELIFGWALHAMATYERTVSHIGLRAPRVAAFLDEVVVMTVGAIGAEPSQAARTLRSAPPPEVRGR